MEEKIFTRIFSLSQSQVESQRVDRLRPATEEIIKETQDCKDVVVLYGIRGVGKTTLLTEIARRDPQSFYVNAEVLVRLGVDLLDFLQEVHDRGYSRVLVDEVHSFQEWEKDVKIFYDSTRTVVWASGSSMIGLIAQATELSRRVRKIFLGPLSFREYVFLKHGRLLPKKTLDEIISQKRELARQIAPFVPSFEKYAGGEALPAYYSTKNPDVFMSILERMINNDLAYVREVDKETVDAAFKIMRVIATSPPGQVSYNRLARTLMKSTKFVISLLEDLNSIGILRKVNACGRGHKSVRKQAKFLLAFPFRKQLCTEYGAPENVGGVREDFFTEFVKNACYVRESGRKAPDYMADSKIFEIGGRSKGRAQTGTKGYILKESLDTSGNSIPLYLIGLLN